ncbi:MAG: mechanosensitive ion channel [Desulfonauticus sp.]|nr:mechanosensitive ion channel [Desulfonauticus sp.]
MFGLNYIFSLFANLWVKFAVFLLVIYLSYFLSKNIFLNFLKKFFVKTKNIKDDLLIKNKILDYLVLIIPGILFYYFVDMFPYISLYGKKLAFIYLIIIFILITVKFLDFLNDLYNTYEISKNRPIKGYLQLLKIFIYILGFIFIISYLLDRSPWGLISGIGALTAVVLIIFKDTILSFVASLQINSYDLIRVGDWIEMPSLGVDGNVIDISLHIVKVQNFDKTIVTVPTYKFLDMSFKNWRGMYETGARRIKRSLLIDQSSVRFLSSEEVEDLKKVKLLQNYLQKKEQELCQANAFHKDSIVLNGRYLTNLGTYRAYVLEYLLRHPLVNKNLTLLVRHLQPEADKGLPLEVYCFVKETRWAEYEKIQADIFDHLLAALPFFGLRAYQRNALIDKRDKLAIGFIK